MQEMEGKDFTKTTLKYPVEFRIHTNEKGVTELEVIFYLLGDARNQNDVTLYQTDQGSGVKVWNLLKQKQDSQYAVLTKLDPTKKQEGLYVTYKELSKIKGVGSVRVSYQTEYFLFDPKQSYSRSSIAALVGYIVGGLAVAVVSLAVVLTVCLYRWWWWWWWWWWCSVQSRCHHKMDMTNTNNRTTVAPSHK
jgi:hypothetical protein